MGYRVEANLLGTASVLLDGVPVAFPYRQAEAMVYYLLLAKHADSAALADLLWGERGGEERVRSSLRNAVYVVRKLFGREFLQERQGGVLMLGPEYELRVDVDGFLSGGPLALYRGEFLSGFFLRDNTALNDWIDSTRQHLCGCYVQRLRQAVTESFAQSSFAECEGLCARLREADEFDEAPYRFSMELCARRGQYTQALQMFADMKKLFAEELSTQPSRALCELAAQLTAAREQELAALLGKKRAVREEAPPAALFYGRQQETAAASAQLERFFAGGESRHVLLLGEAGIGKTTLAQRMLEHSANAGGTLRAQAVCYHAEAQYPLGPWQSMLRRLVAVLERQEPTAHGTALLQSIGRVFPFLRGECGAPLEHDDITSMDWNGVRGLLISALSDFSRAQPLLLFFDDIQWMDEISLSLLRGLITGGGNVLFLLAARTELGAAAEAFVQDTRRLGRLELVTLGRFGYEDTARLAKLLLPDYPFTDAILDSLFRETEGNAFFITEVVNHIKYNGSPADITPNMRGILGQRISPLPPDHRQVLGLLSVLFGGAPFGLLTELCDKGEDGLLEILEDLMARRLVREEAGPDDTFFTFTHQKLQEYVYGEMTQTRRRLLHNRAGLCYERRLHGTGADIPLYTKLIYHFERGANRSGYLKYAVRYLSVYLNAAHEYFPTLEGGALTGLGGEGNGSLNRLSDELGAMEQLLHSVEESVQQDAAPGQWSGGDTELLAEFLHMAGRHYIRNSSYRRGLGYILRLKELAAEMPAELRRQSIIRANRQLICVYINRYELKRLEEVAAQSLALLEGDCTVAPEERAVWCRLRGLGCIMAGRLAEGRGALEEAIAVFEHSAQRTKYLYNLAASYAWLGEAARHEARYEVAHGYYGKAVELCRSFFIVGGVCIFYTYDGMALLDSGNFAAAGERLRLAVECYERVNLMWGRGLANCYCAQLALHEKRYAEAARLLRDAWAFAVRLESNYEKGVICRVCAQLCASLAEHPELAEHFAALKKPPRFYVAAARRYFRHVYSPVDEGYLLALEKLQKP